MGVVFRAGLLRERARKGDESTVRGHHRPARPIRAMDYERLEPLRSIETVGLYLASVAVYAAADAFLWMFGGGKLGSRGGPRLLLGPPPPPATPAASASLSSSSGLSVAHQLSPRWFGLGPAAACGGRVSPEPPSTSHGSGAAAPTPRADAEDGAGEQPEVSDNYNAPRHIRVAPAQPAGTWPAWMQAAAGGTGAGSSGGDDRIVVDRSAAATLYRVSHLPPIGRPARAH